MVSTTNINYESENKRNHKTEAQNGEDYKNN